jgi:hypothetical protein
MARPVFGSASAEMSASARVLQAEMPLCHEGLVTSDEQPLPAPAQADSDQPRLVPDARSSDVPPTEVTYCDVDG